MNLNENYITANNMPGQIIDRRDIDVIDEQKKITVITICNKLCAEFDITLKSVFNQTLYNFDFIIVTKTGFELEKHINNLGIKDNRIKILEYDYKDNADAKKTAIKNSDTDYICILNENVYIEKTYLECMKISIINNSRVFGFSNVIDKSKGFNILNDDIKTIFKEGLQIYTGAYVVLKEIVIKVSGFESSHQEDFELWIKMIQEGYYPVKINNYGIWNDNKNIYNLKLTINKNILNNLNKSVEFPVNDNYNTDTFPVILQDNTIFKKTKKNILILFPCVVVGGADKFLLDLVKGLDKNNYEITIIFTRVSDYVWRPLFELEVNEIFDLTDFATRGEWAGFIEYIIRTRQIDLMFCSNSMYGYHVIPWIKNKYPMLPIVDYIHAEDWTWKAGGLPRDSIGVSRFIDKTYTCTKHLENVMYEKMNKKYRNTMPVYIGVDNEYFDRSKINYDNYEFYDKFKKYENKKVVLFMCRLVHLKRPLFAVRVLENLVKQDENIVLFVVGDGECLGQMKNEVKKLKLEKNVEFFGMNKDVRPFYKVAKVTLVTSLTEGLTLTAYESLSMGTPVVSSDVGGQKELIDDKCGKIIKKYQDYVKDLYNYNYDQNEIEEYSNAILDIIYNKNYEKISNYCVDKINAKFSIKIMVDTMSNEFNKLIKSKSNIDIDICNNEELAERYLILYNDTHKYFKPTIVENRKSIIYKLLDLFGIVAILKFLILNSGIIGIKESYKFKYMLWDIPLYRFLVINIKRVLGRK